MPAKKYIVSLSVEESQNLDKLTKASKGVAAKINHAHSRCESPRRRMKRSRDLLHPTFRTSKSSIQKLHLRVMKN
jgi:hypothetical protein